MPCYLPLRAWQSASGAVGLGRPPNDSAPLALPCGKCIGCRQANAKAWALRCHLELQQHDHAAFTTLTYHDRWLPPTLEKRDLQLFLKRFRKSLGPARPIRFFASGEYGEKRGRPHFHALLFGANPIEDAETVQRAWTKGHTYTVPVTPAAVSYVAGYTAKKYGDTSKPYREERVDPETGEVYRYQPPFIQMSRGGRHGYGIGGKAKQHTSSWRSFAVHNGTMMPVPRYLHEAWKAQATPEQLEQLATEKQNHRMSREKITREQLHAALEIALAKQALKASRRKL